MEKLRILIVQDTDWIRRNPIQHTHLSERLAKRGHDIRVIDYEILWGTEGKKELLSKRQTFNVSRLIENSNITVIRPSILKIPLLDYFSMLFTYRNEIKAQIKDFKPDVIIGNDILTPLLAYGAAKKTRIPTIFYAIDIEHKLIPYRFLQYIGKLIERKNIRDADLVISINEGLRDYTVKMGAKPDKTLVIRAGIDSNVFDSRISPDEIKDKYGIAKDDKILFFMGWLYHFSGLKETAIELSKINNGMKMLLVGDGDAYNDLSDIKSKYKLNDRLILAGKQPYDILPKYIAAADICLLPAYNNEIMRDIVPIKMYEYMAMGKPVISTKLPGVMKEFGDNNGLVYIDKPEDTVTKAIELIDNGQYKVEGIKAKKFTEKLDWEIITDEYEKVLYQLVKDQRNN